MLSSRNILNSFETGFSPSANPAGLLFFLFGNSILQVMCAVLASAFHLRDFEVWKRLEPSLLTVRMNSSLGSQATPSAKWS